MRWDYWRRKLTDSGYIKPIGTTFVVTGLGWILYEVYATANTLRTIARIDVVSHAVKYIHVDERTSKGMVLGRQGYLEQQLGRRLASWVHRNRYQVACKLLHMAQSPDPEVRVQAVQSLASSHHLSESDLIQLAQACDAHTAIGLARCRSINRGFFLPPSRLYKTSSKEGLVTEIRDVLYTLNQVSGHLCVKYFLTKAFPEYEKQNNYLLDEEVMLTEPWTILTSDDNLLPMCVQALDHHISTLNNEKLLVELEGLPMLMAIYQHLKDNISVSKMVCRLLTRICEHREFLPQIFESGWVGILAEWLSSDDQHLSLMAGQCLSNLDRDDPIHARYGKHVISLHPTFRASVPDVDVVFVHGLLGGVLSTWRQREHRDPAIMAFQKDDITASTLQRQTSDEHTKEYLSAMDELTLTEWEQLGSDYEFVVSDFPVFCKAQACHLYSVGGKDPLVRRNGADRSYSLCWPRDWLPADCHSIRVLGIDYDSRISDWFPTCSEKLRVNTLEEKSKVVLRELKMCGIGSRPTVWVAHSMGGLLVKKMLSKALSSEEYETRRIAHNTKAVVFLSTPHLGCPLAKMNDILNYLLWPSTEVEELRYKSGVLSELHEQFNHFLEHVNVKIVTFAEAKSTRITSLGVDLHIVPPEFSYLDVGDLFEMPCDHACVAKPWNKLSFIYQTILNVIKGVQREQVGLINKQK